MMILNVLDDIIKALNFTVHIKWINAEKHFGKSEFGNGSM